ncbi:MAG: hypothetical protein WB507_06235 [Solirubrobacterales bacterium]
MPGGKRTDHISQRDLEVLEFIARFGVVPRSAVATWAGTARTVTIVREGRLRKAELIRVTRGMGEGGPYAACTKAGLRASGRRELTEASFSWTAFSHHAVVARVAAQMERSGQSLLSEREILALERADGDRVLSATPPNSRPHRADLIRVDERGEPLEAIEVELTTKGAARLDRLMRAWRQAVMQRRVSRVVYRCAPRTRPYVERAIERTLTGEMIKVEELWR